MLIDHFLHYCEQVTEVDCITSKEVSGAMAQIPSVNKWIDVTQRDCKHITENE